MASFLIYVIRLYLINCVLVILSSGSKTVPSDLTIPTLKSYFSRRSEIVLFKMKLQ